MMRRAAFAVVALLAVAMFARPLVRGEVLIFRDHSDYFQPLRFFTAEELRHFRLPLWNPYNASGEPWLANPQTAVFYPPSWIFLIAPFATAYVLFLLLHVALLGFGGYLLFTRLASHRAALLGAVMLMFCGPSLSLLDVSNNLTTFAWLPLILWCALAGVSAAWSGAAMAMSFLGGEPLLAALGALSFAVIRGRRGTLDAALTSILVSGVQLAPFLSFVRHSDRATSVPREEILLHSMPLRDWLGVAWPYAPLHQQFIPVVYIGVITSILAVVGLFTRRRAAVVCAAVVLASMLIAAGSFLPLMGTILTRLPLTVIRYPARVVPLAALALVTLAVLGWEKLQGRIPLSHAVVIALVLIDLVPRVAPLLESGPFDAHPIPYPRVIGRDGKIARLMAERAQQPRFNRRAWIAGYLNLFERRFDAWTAAPMVSESYTRAYETAFRRRDLLDAMSIEYILDAPGGQVVVHRNPQAYPLAYWRDGEGRMMPAAMLAFTTSAAHVTLDAPADGEVVITQQNSAGWQVEVDGASAEPVSAGVFRAVRVRRGHHSVSWRYRPAALMLGIAMSIAGIVRLLLSTSFVKRRWHKNFFSRAR